MKQLALVAALLLAFSAGVLSQEARQPTLYTPTETEWLALHAQAYHGGTHQFPEYAFSIVPEGPGKIAVVGRYFVALGANERNARGFTEKVAERVRADLADKAITVEARLERVD